MKIKIIFFLLIASLFLGNTALAQISYEKAIVLEVKEKQQKTEEADKTQYQTIQQVKIKILSGKYKGQERIIENTLTNNPMDIKVKKNNKILVFLEEKDNNLTIQIQDHWRLSFLIYLTLFFLFLLLILGGRQGLKVIFALIISVFLFFQVLIPRILSGANPLILSLIISVLVAVITLFLVGGFKKKTVSAILGTMGGLIIATLLALLAGKAANLTGFGGEEARMLFAKFPSFNFQGILFSGVIIGAVGAVMDTAMSIASSISEIKTANPEIKTSRLIKSGLSVGKDTMGTMSITLIFAYIGVSLPLLLLFTDLGESYLKFLNFNFIAEEVVRSIAGSIGLVMAIPLTAVVSGILENRK